MLSQQDEVISGVLGDILDGAIRAKKTQIDPSPSWFMSTMSGWEGMLIAATEEAEGVNDVNQVETDLTETNKYTCGECGKNEILKEEMKEHLNKIHGHHISLEDTPNVKIIQTTEVALKKKVELYEAAIQNLQKKQTKRLLTISKSLKRIARK